jgi:uncharacterized membrane protein
MAKGVYTVLVPLISLLLVSPIVGINQNIVENHSEFLAGDFDDISRDGDYDVSLELAPENQGISSVTRNEEIQNEFIVTNGGNLDDTYDLSVSWNDSYDKGWHAEPDVDAVSISAGNDETISFTFRAPVQGVYAGDYLVFTVKVASQNSTSTNASLEQRLEIDMTYAVDVSTRGETSLSGGRGETVSYVVEVTNVGDTSEEFSIDVGSLPKDWTATTSVPTIELGPDESGNVDLTVEIPNTAAEDEFAIIRASAHVQETGYDHIYGYLDTTTTVNDGRVYGVNIVAEVYELQVIPGGHILYNLYVTNTGEETDSFLLTLGEVKSGWSSDLSQFSIDDLAPDEPTNVVLSVSCPSDSVEDEWSWAYVSVESSNRGQFNDNLTTTTSVRIPVRDVSLAVELDSLSGNPDATMVYSMTLTNTGTDPDDFSLSVVRCDDCAAWGVSLSTPFIEDVDPGLSRDFEFSVEIPPSARNTDYAVMSVVVTSVANSSISASVDTTTTVNNVYNNQIIWNGMQTLNPGDASHFEITLINRGNSVQSYIFSDNGILNGWGFEDTFPYSTEALDPYSGQESFTVPFVVPSDASPGYFNFTVDLVLNESGIKVDELVLSIKVEYYAEFAIDVIEIESFDGPGATHVFGVELTNNANAEDTIALHVKDLPDGWSYCISSDCVTSITVGKGQKESFELKVTSSPTEAADTLNGAFMSLVGVSGLNNKVDSYDTFTVYTNPVYQLGASASDYQKDGESGDIIPFPFTVTNNGNGIDYVSLPSAVSPAGWIATFSESSFTLAPSQSKVVYLNVEIPANVYGGDNAIQVQVSSDQSGQTIDMEFVIYIPEKADVNVELKTTAGDVTAGNTGKFIVRLTNSGNTIESLSLLIEGKRASWFTLPTDTIDLEPGGYLEIIIEVNPPITQAGGETSGILSVTLSSDTSSTTKVTLPFTVLKSDALPEEIPEEEEESSLPGPSLISVLLVITLLSMLRRRI